MPYSMEPSTNQAAAIYLRAAEVGAVSTVLIAVCAVTGMPEWTARVAGIFGLFALVVLLRPSWLRRDEYLNELWNAGTSAAFLTVILVAMVGDAAAGAFDAIFEGERSIAPEIKSGGFFILVSLLAFYAGFHWRRFRSRG